MEEKSLPKIIRDPVHNIISFENNSCDRLLLKLINTKEFQRLRRIKQLGMCDLVFPGATHSRFAHSIGVMHIAKMILARLKRFLPKGTLTGEQCTVVLVAALLHDIGHGPFSHAFEKYTGKDHEKWTREIIQDGETEIHQKLKEHDKELPELITSFFLEESYLSQIVDSQLDADRFDYLLRDSHATGTNYGNYDLHWLIEHLYLDEEKKRFYLGRKAVSATEDYLFARFHMHQTVYYHKATRAAENMLKLILERYSYLLKNEDKAENKIRIVPDSPLIVLRAFSGEISLAEYLALDDNTLMEFIKSCQNAKDKVLESLGSGLSNRLLYKCTDVTDFAADLDSDKIANFKIEATNLISKKGFDTYYALVSDTASVTGYTLYKPDKAKPSTQIYIEKSSGEQVDIIEYSDPVAGLTAKQKNLRYYYPASIRDDIRKIAVDTLS